MGLNKTHQDRIIKAIVWICFISCLSGFLYHCYDCFKKYISCPQGVEISTQPQTTLDFPSITFCPYQQASHLGNPEAYNRTLLDYCGLNLGLDIDPQFISSDCQDPKEIWKKATPKLKDFGFLFAWITYQDREEFEINFDEDNPMWRRMVSWMMGACYTLTLPKEIRKKPIHFIRFNVEVSKYFEIYVHPQGLMMIDPDSALELQSFRMKPNNLYYRFHADYQQKTLLDFAGKECEARQDSYDFGQCVENEIHEVNKTENILFRYLI